MDIRGTKTQENLLRAFNVESEAKNKYEIYAAKAKKDGYEQNALIRLCCITISHHDFCRTYP